VGSNILKPGAQLGSFEITGLLGKGGMGEVYRARDSRLKRDVAIKILPEEFSRDRERTRRFQREAEILASFNHSNIAAIYDLEEINGLRFLVLELVEGETLADRIRRGPMAVDEVLSVARSICGALEAAHGKGVTHRDLKPGNVVIAAGGGVKVLDFGMAKTDQRESVAANLLVASDTVLQTTPGIILGTLEYMSPEQALGRPADARSDIFSFGVLLYEMLTGQRPFKGETVLDRLHALVHTPALAIEKLRPDIPPHLRAAVEKAMRKDSAERYTSIRDMAADLRSAQTSRTPAETAEAGTTGNGNLPLHLTSFIGRVRETAEVCRLLDNTRLLTLTGVGGTGKTRLALQAASAAVNSFSNGAWLVELAPLADPLLVPKTIATVLHLSESKDGSFLNALTDYLRDKHLLLIVDNCEHLIQAYAQVADAILRTCPRVHLLTTSREALGIAGEVSWPVLSMQTPDLATVPTAAQVSQYEAVQLFIERATAVRNDFRLTDSNAPTVAQICRRLDGIPLAIELAAARSKVFSMEQIAERLDDRFRLLTGGSRTALPRQQTLRALIDWSHSLLSPSEVVLFRRLSVFAGGWTYEAAEAVCAGDGLDTNAVLDVLSRLIDKSLVIVTESPNHARYHLLETIREYAADKLMESGESQLLRKRHLDFYLTLAETVQPYLQDQSRLLDRLELELDNLRVALDWAMGSRAIELGMQLLAASKDFWWLRGHHRECLNKLKEFRAQPEAAGRTSARARALLTEGFLNSWVLSNFAEARPLLEQSLTLARELRDTNCMTWAQIHLSVAVQNQGDYEKARALLEESKVLAESLPHSDSFSNDALGYVLRRQADLAFLTGDNRARDLWEASIDYQKKHKYSGGLPYSLRRLGQAELREGNISRAAGFIAESLRLNATIGDKQGVAASLAAAAAVLMARERVAHAATLLGAVDSLLSGIGFQLLHIDHVEYSTNLSVVRGQLDASTFDDAWFEGQNLTMEQAIQSALDTNSRRVMDAPRDVANRPYLTAIESDDD
jgi:predicted ATPase/tRNA A-37 threonylcarbamoyl transferase component Bud32